MKIQKILFSFALVCLVLTGCKSEPKKEKLAVKKENVSLAISGMTCEIGCAKTIQSKLSKKEGVLDAKVVFTDSIANIEYDANTTSKEDLAAFVSGIAGGELYKASIASKKTAHACTEECKETCKNKTSASEKEKECCSLNDDGTTFCKEDCKMACCTDKAAA
ncbi:cation transporter [Polaribacter sargassicola]|uniref:cation transporter n=1 Tax=Polaribacter sargassicola TaxID=2836891 RepID=UPI001F3CA4FC|nr:heavy metal-associated domain-containing protein [Polaribacter sp. DS7-9]MCG1034882.1 heavy-metal-associated domain-containing protein [Polaribacter sp. DS7-9]